MDSLFTADWALPIYKYPWQHIQLCRGMVLNFWDYEIMNHLLKSHLCSASADPTAVKRTANFPKMRLVLLAPADTQV